MADDYVMMSDGNVRIILSFYIEVEEPVDKVFVGSVDTLTSIPSRHSGVPTIRR